MKEKEPRRIRTLSGFVKWVAQFTDGGFLFRGVSKDYYTIQASACRRLPEAERSNPYRLLQINTRLIEEARLLGHDQKNGQRLSDLDLLAELQHFGAATCLIDFTRNALVALWFACQRSSKDGNQKKEANGKVFAVPRAGVGRFETVDTKLIEKDIDYFFKPDDSGRYQLFQWEPKLQNNRIIAQHSVFLFSGDQIEAADECVIMKNSKQKIRDSLSQLSDIDEASMYPDFDGFARLHAHDMPYTEPNAHDYLQHGIVAHQRGEVDNAIDYYDKVISLLDPEGDSE